MPNATVHNKTSSTLNIAFSITTPLAFHNDVKPDTKVHFPLSTFVHGFEARIDSGQNRFSANESWKKVGEIGTACAAGATAVTLGAGWLFGAFGRLGSPIGAAALTGAGASWQTANALGAQYGRSGEGAVCVSKVWIPFYDKHYSVRHVDGRFVLWDDDENCSIN